MSALEGSEIVEQLKEAGSHLLKLPSEKDEILKLLEELEAILSKVDQGPSQTIQEALLPSLKALLSDHILKSSDSDIKITVAVCFNEIMRITAPDSPYGDTRMKEIFELIVASFDKLSLLSGISYDKALKIINNVAKVKSCVMMLDIECDELIIEMFRQFKRNLRSDHPPSVSSDMEEIMSHIIDESEDIPLELLKVLLDFVQKEKEGNLAQSALPVSWSLGEKVMKKCSKKIKPYLRAAIKSGDIRKDDYAPLVFSILEADSDIEQNHVADSTQQEVAKKSADVSPSPEDVGKSDAATATANLVLSTITMMESQDTAVMQKSSQASGPDKQSNVPVLDTIIIQKPLKASGHAKQSNASLLDTTIIQTPLKTSGNDKQSNASDNTDMKAETQKGNEKKFPVKGQEGPLKKSLSNPLGRTKKSFVVASKNDKALMGILPSKESEMLTEAGKKNYQDASVRPNHSGKKLAKVKKGAGEGSGKKGPSSNLGMSSSEKERNGMDETAKKALRRKRDQMDDEVFETPFGIKKYKEDIVGCKLKVWWPKDKAYYEGRIASYSPEKRKHKVLYDDGDVEVLNLINEKFEFIGDEIAVINRKIDAKPHPSSNELRAKHDHSANRTEKPKTASKDSNAT